MTFQLTDEQLACLEATRSSSQSLLINALAGAAKTTTLVHIAAALPVAPTLCVAFNKRIAEEMAKRMPSFVTCQTLNSLGHQVWGRVLGRKMKLDTDKVYNLTTQMMNSLPKEKSKELRQDFSSIMKAVRICKSAGYVPEKMRTVGKTLCSSEDLLETFAQQLDIDPSDEFLSLVDRILESNIAEAFSGLIDFDDQIYMSTLFGGTFPRYSNVMVDESQDLSPLNHEMLRRMKFDRLIAVGDPHQAIYAFRGASHTSMAELKHDFGMLELTLSTSFRCPKAVVRNAHWRVPHMRFPAWAQEGSVTILDEWSAHSIPDGAAIICRNNAPIFGAAMKLIRAGRGIKILGNDIGAGLVKILSGLGPGDSSAKEALALVDSWETKEIRKAHKARVVSIRDKGECLRVFIANTESLDEAIAYAKTIFAASGPIQLMTGHKSKGGEWDTVFHLDSFLVPSKWALRQAEETGDESQLIQEKNLKYVIETQAKESLFFINLEDYQ